MCIRDRDLTDFVNSVKKQTEGWFEKLLGTIRGKSPITPEEAWKRAEDFAIWTNMAITALLSGITAIEGLTGGQVDITLVQWLDLPVVRAAIEATNDFCREAWVGGFAPLISQYWAKEVRPALPTVDEALAMMWRGRLSEEDVREVARRRGFHDKFIEGFLEVGRRIPSPADLIVFVTREAFDAKVVQNAVQPYQWYLKPFLEAMRKHGYDDMWSLMYWTAHFRRAPLEAFRLAWSLGKLSEEEFEKRLGLADYHPEDWEIIKAATWNPLPLYVLRHAIRAGRISRDEIIEDVKRRMYDPRFVETVADAEIYASFEPFINDLVNDIKDKYMAGWISREQAEEELTALGLTEARIAFELADADEQIELEKKETLLRIFLEAYKRGKMSAERLQEALTELGLQQWRIDLERELIDVRRKTGVE